MSGPSSVSLDVILLDLLNSFSVGISADARDLGWIDAAMLTLFAFGIFFATPRFQISKERNVPYAFRNSIILLAFLVIPLTALQLATLYRPLYQNSRYFIALSPAFYLGVAAGIAALAEKFKLAAVAALAIFLLGAGISLNNLFFVPRYGKDDHRAWTDYLRARVRPGDVLILNSPHTEALFNYYARDLLPYTTLPILRADAAPFDEMENRNAVRDLVRAHPRVWYLALHVPFDDPDARIEKFLDAEGVRIERTNFPGVSTAISLSQFLPALPVLRDRADIARPVNFLFGASLRLVGFDAPAQIESGARAIVKLDWQLDQPVGEDFGASLRVVDNAGAVWGEWDSL
ncbi:MAG: hypothetical protein HY070_08960, partial [Chloroflexi bacterium]|nr:hypothetical protein [Chloroflexota bacterium]